MLIRLPLNRVPLMIKELLFIVSIIEGSDSWILLNKHKILLNIFGPLIILANNNKIVKPNLLVYYPLF